MQASRLYGQSCCNGHFFSFSGGIFALVEKRVYAGALIKKLRYFPKSVSGDIIDRNFVENYVGGVDMLEANI